MDIGWQLMARPIETAGVAMCVSWLDICCLQCTFKAVQHSSLLLVADSTVQAKYKWGFLAAPLP